MNIPFEMIIIAAIAVAILVTIIAVVIKKQNQEVDDDYQWSAENRKKRAKQNSKRKVQNNKSKSKDDAVIYNSAHFSDAVEKIKKDLADEEEKKNNLLNAKWDAEEAASEANEASKAAKEAAERAEDLRKKLEAEGIIHSSTVTADNITDEIERIKRESVFKEEKVLAARAESKRLAAVAAKKAYEELKMTLEQEKSDEHTPAEDIGEDSDKVIDDEVTNEKVIDDESGDDEVINDKIIERESFGTGEHSSTIGFLALIVVIAFNFALWNLIQPSIDQTVVGVINYPFPTNGIGAIALTIIEAIIIRLAAINIYEVFSGVATKEEMKDVDTAKLTAIFATVAAFIIGTVGMLGCRLSYDIITEDSYSRYSPLSGTVYYEWDDLVYFEYNELGNLGYMDANVYVEFDEDKTPYIYYQNFQPAKFRDLTDAAEAKYGEGNSKDLLDYIFLEKYAYVNEQTNE